MTGSFNNNALIIFSRLPVGSETKTRLAGVLTEQEREQLHRKIYLKACYSLEINLISLMFIFTGRVLKLILKIILILYPKALYCADSARAGAWATECARPCSLYL